MNFYLKVRAVLLVTLLLFLATCGFEPIRKYRIPKDFLVSVKENNLIQQWSPPANWKEKNPTSMRIRSFSIPDQDSNSAGDFGLIVMPLAGNRLSDNINLWRSELKLEPIKLGEEKNYYTETQINGYPVYLVDMASKESLIKGLSPERTLVIFFSYKDQQYFFKLQGSSNLINKEKGSLLGSLEKIRFE